LSAKGKVTVNAEGNVDNEGVIDGHTATSVTAGQKVTNHKAARIVSENGDVYVITNGIVDNNGFIQGKTGTTVVEGQRQSKDNLMSDLIHTLGDIQRTVRSSLRAAENEQHPSSSAKSLMFYDKGRAVNKVASIISHGSVCSVEFFYFLALPLNVANKDIQKHKGRFCLVNLLPLNQSLESFDAQANHQRYFYNLFESFFV
ncbi:hypothetical protein HAINFHK1212_0867, partial [Haemophilus influenzae HK1212]